MLQESDNISPAKNSESGIKATAQLAQLASKLEVARFSELQSVEGMLECWVCESISAEDSWAMHVIGPPT